jgi:hypothetical protein
VELARSVRTALPAVVIPLVNRVRHY